MNTFIFDLDGTLLPMPKQEEFLDTYFKALSQKLIFHGMDPQKLMKAVLIGTEAMIKNDGTMTNEQRFWNEFSKVVGEDARQMESLFDDFYRNEFSAAKNTTYTHPHAKECILCLKEKGYQIALATNPLFPKIATHTRIKWAGLEIEDFEHITTYENSSFCKPNLEYYMEVLKNMGKNPDECIMVGNDVKEDMCAASLGMDTYLLKDCLICSQEADISNIKQGDFDELLDFIKQLPSLINE